MAAETSQGPLSHAGDSLVSVRATSLLTFTPTPDTLNSRRQACLGALYIGIAILLATGLLFLSYGDTAADHLPQLIILAPFAVGSLLKGLWGGSCDFISGRIATSLYANQRTLAIRRGKRPTRYVKRADVLGFHVASRSLVLQDHSSISLLYTLHPDRKRFDETFFEPLLAHWWGGTAENLLSPIAAPVVEANANDIIASREGQLC